MQVFSSFREAGISDLVVDLRYNTGGDLRLSVDLGSLMVPRTSDSLQVAVKVEYNDKLNKAYKALGLVPILYFNKDEDNCYVGDIIDKIVILTGPNTASSSEVLINMLLPYKQPILIGTKTYGKNYGSQVFTSPNPEIKCVLQPITMKVYNGAGHSDFENGFEPDYAIDELYYPMKPFGDKEEPLMSKALSVICNAETRSVGIEKKQTLSEKLKPWKSSIDECSELVEENIIPQDVIKFVEQEDNKYKVQ